MSYEGEVIWKCGLEYNPEGKLYGDPYYYITKTRDEKYNLLRLNPENREYIIVKTVDKEESNELDAEAMDLWKKLEGILFPKNEHGEKNYYYYYKLKRNKDFEPIMDDEN